MIVLWVFYCVDIYVLDHCIYVDNLYIYTCNGRQDFRRQKCEGLMYLYFMSHVCCVEALTKMCIVFVIFYFY